MERGVRGAGLGMHSINYNTQECAAGKAEGVWGAAEGHRRQAAESRIGVQSL